MDESVEKSSFLGTGWSFPPSFDKARDTVKMVSEEKDIEQSLALILGTVPGERAMNPEFGCDLKSMSFASIDSHTLNTIKDIVKRAILRFEPRVTLNEVVVDASEYIDGVIRVNLFYTIRKINVRTNMVYPFYLEEGTNIKLDY
ncbi:baseplate protein [Fulvitalea axinellae]|uniref:Baseplate protein n=1 Tax=Fulvitalea axinellae TaxID=1182444 RepID=A0AAU9D240_9BACT|nr:baseplate protein [Fulvitalea axinellae]